MKKRLKKVGMLWSLLLVVAVCSYGDSHHVSKGKTPFSLTIDAAGNVYTIWREVKNVYKPKKDRFHLSVFDKNKRHVVSTQLEVDTDFVDPVRGIEYFGGKVLLLTSSQIYEVSPKGKVTPFKEAFANRFTFSADRSKMAVLTFGGIVHHMWVYDSDFNLLWESFEHSMGFVLKEGHIFTTDLEGMYLTNEGNILATFPEQNACYFIRQGQKTKKVSLGDLAGYLPTLAIGQFPDGKIVMCGGLGANEEGISDKLYYATFDESTAQVSNVQISKTPQNILTHFGLNAKKLRKKEVIENVKPTKVLSDEAGNAYMGFRSVSGALFKQSRVGDGARVQSNHFISGSSFIFKFSPTGELADSWLIPSSTKEKGIHEKVGGLIFKMKNDVPVVFTNNNTKNLTGSVASQKSAKKVTSNSKAYAITLKANGQLEPQALEVDDSFYMIPTIYTANDGKITTMLASGSRLKPLTIEF